MTGNGESLKVTALQHKRVSGVPPSPLTLAEWVNWGFCPPEALHEAGRLYVDLTMLAPLRVKFGTDVRADWYERKRYDGLLLRVEVNADSISFHWRDDPVPKDYGDNQRTEKELKELNETIERVPEEDWSDLPGVKDKRISLDVLRDFKELNAIIERVSGKGRGERPRYKPPKIRRNDSSLAELVDLWNDTPKTARPAQFPLDPVVGALVGSRVSLGDYLPTFRFYQQDVRRAVDRDEEMNGQDAHSVLLEIMSSDSEKHDLLIGLLRADAGSLEKRVGEEIKTLIPKLGTLDDVNHSRVVRALDYAVGSKRSNSTDWRRSYYKARATKRRSTLRTM